MLSSSTQHRIRQHHPPSSRPTPTSSEDYNSLAASASPSPTAAGTRLRFWRNAHVPTPVAALALSPPHHRPHTPLASSTAQPGSPCSVIVIEPPSPPFFPQPAFLAPSPLPDAPPDRPDTPNSTASTSSRSSSSFVRSVHAALSMSRSMIVEVEGGLRRSKSRIGMRLRGGGEDGRGSPIPDLPPRAPTPTIPPPPPPVPPIPHNTTPPNSNRFSLLSTLTPSLRSDRSDTPEGEMWPKTPGEGVGIGMGEDGCAQDGGGGLWDLPPELVAMAHIQTSHGSGPDAIRSRSRGNSLSLSHSTSTLQDASLRTRPSTRSRLPSLNAPPLSLRPTPSSGGIRKLASSTPPRPSPASPPRGQGAKIVVRSLFPTPNADPGTITDLLEKFPLPPGFPAFSPPAQAPIHEGDVSLVLGDSSFTLLDLATLDLSLENLEGTALFDRDYGEPPAGGTPLMRAPPPSVEATPAREYDAHPFASASPASGSVYAGEPRRRPSTPSRRAVPPHLPTWTEHPHTRPPARSASVHPFARTAEFELDVDMDVEASLLRIAEESNGSIHLAYAR